MRKPRIGLFMLVLIGLCLAAVLLYYLPPVHDRLAWRVANWQGQIQRWLNPPEQVVFVPGASQPGAIQTIAQATLSVLLPTSTPAPPVQATGTVQAVQTLPASATPPPTFTPAPTATPIPPQTLLTGIVYQNQQFNNCGPANLAMALSFWGWQGDQNDTRAYLRPNREVDDKNVMPEEMVAYVEQFAGLRALARVGGDLEMLKQLIAAGFPVLIEKGHHPADDWWMGHYMVLNGYDEARAAFTAQDSLAQPDVSLPYEEMASRWWRDFNYVYLIIYPAEREAQVMDILGPHSDPAYNYQYAAQKAQAEIPSLQGRDLYFAWFSLGSSLVGRQDYPGAADAYDQAFAIYPSLSEKDRPYRMMWYQVGPYLAYYYTGRYQDVINLANTTFQWAGKQVLEETFYWRGMAYEALGELNLAVADYKKAATLNPNYVLPRQALERLGVETPGGG
ncbi:MAG: C39 family peptidase [Anaerolineales bacterium]|nr:C39 family peptidase [Anaerolineales bacterium]